MAVEGRRDLLSQLLAQRHPGGRGQLPAIGKHWVAEGVAPRGIQGPGGVGGDNSLTEQLAQRHTEEADEKAGIILSAQLEWVDGNE